MRVATLPRPVPPPMPPPLPPPVPPPVPPHTPLSRTPLSHKERAAIRDSLFGLTQEAGRFIAVPRIAALVEAWLGMGRSEAANNARALNAFGLAGTIVLFTPSLTGSTAFDRLAKARSLSSATEQAALAALRAARLRLLRIDAQGPDGVACTDIASGETVHEVGGTLDDVPPGEHALAWLAPLSDGSQLVTTMAPLLDPEALQIALRFIQPGRPALLQPLKCATAVYAHLACTALDEEEDDLAPGPFDRIAATWSAQPGPRDPEDILAVRREANLATILGVLVTIARLQERRISRLLGAFEEIAILLIDTVQRRAAIGSDTVRLAEVTAQLDVLIANGTVPRQTREVFKDIRRRAGAGPTTATAGVEQERLIARIQGLRAKTVQQGCTEQEAMSAAAKVAELLDRYGLTLGEAEIRSQECDSMAVETGRMRAAPIDSCVPAAAAFFDCRVWSERNASGELRFVYLGLPTDVAAARYLHDLIEAAFRTETARFQSGPIYLAQVAGGRRKATTSFQVGLARGIIAKLSSLHADRDAARRDATGRALVLAKSDAIERTMSALGLDLRARRPKRRNVMTEAFTKGHEAGMAFEYTPGIDHDP